MDRLRTALERHYAHWQISALTPVGQGLEAMVCRGESALLGPVAIKVPWTRQIANANDEGQDARELLRQEALLAGWLRAHGVPTPVVHGLHESDDLDFLVTSFIETDGSAPGRQDAGRVAAAIHRAPPPTGLMPVAQGAAPLPAVLAERVMRRAAVAAQLSGERFTLPPAPEVAAILAAGAALIERPAVLHMDFRPANLRTRQGAVTGVIDWSNALVGDPALDLARIAESGELCPYGELDEPFLDGYGDPSPLARLPRPVELLYRLDTAVMLANVFLSEAPDPVLARRQVDRTGVLCRLLQKVL